MDDLETSTEKGSRLRVGTQRTLQIVLGLFWLLDAALQFQPFMFGHEFANTFILANAQGQPQPFGYLITHVGNFIAPDSTVWNVFFSLIQLVIGLGLLARRTVRPALVISFFWVLGVWFFGEGLGMVFTGTATALTGAPGSVLIYGLIGLMAWPRRADQPTDASGHDNESVGIASSAAGQGIGGSRTPLMGWSGYWFLAAVLFVLPDNRTQTSVASAITGMASGNPSFYDHLLNNVGRQLNSVGPQAAWTMAAISLIIGFGPLVARRPQPFLWAGIVASIAMWVFGQGWLGGVFTGSGTDPNTGPLVVFLGLAMMPAALPSPAAWRSPFRALAAWNPVVGWGGVVALGGALALSGSYPVAAQETPGMAMSGMSHMGGSGSAGAGASGTVGTTSCSSGNAGIARTGLNLNNTPLMVMSGSLGMDMNGSDASAAAGINSTKANWSYTGPALPNALAQELLKDGGNGADQLKMAATGCAKSPTNSQEINAVQYVQSTSENVAQFSQPIAALAAGYQLVSPANYPVTYFINPAIVSANAAAKRTLSPTHIDGLVYAKTLTGSEVLVAAMYLLPSTVTSAPRPFGALVQWHSRTDVCGPAVAGAVLDISGVTPCTSGTVQRNTPDMTLVWQVPVAGGPLAIQPPDIQIVEAAIMQSMGIAPGS
jgi:hypothetical protein